MSLKNCHGNITTLVLLQKRMMNHFVLFVLASQWMAEYTGTDAAALYSTSPAWLVYSWLKKKIIFGVLVSLELTWEQATSNPMVGLTFK